MGDSCVEMPGRGLVCRAEEAVARSRAGACGWRGDAGRAAGLRARCGHSPRDSSGPRAPCAALLSQVQGRVGGAPQCWPGPSRGLARC